MSKAVLIISGFSPDLHSALWECQEIAEGYGLTADVVLEDYREPVN
jgi:hypothetical protein